MKINLFLVTAVIRMWRTSFVVNSLQKSMPRIPARLQRFSKTFPARFLCLSRRNQVTTSLHMESTTVHDSQLPLPASKPDSNQYKNGITNSYGKVLLSRSEIQLLSDSSLLLMNFDDLSKALGGTGRARTFWNLIRRGIDPLLFEGDVTTEQLSPRVKALMHSLIPYTGKLFTLNITDETVSTCGTRKFLSELDDGLKIESVLIPSSKFDRTTLCVSTQVITSRPFTPP